MVWPSTRELRGLLQEEQAPFSVPKALMGRRGHRGLEGLEGFEGLDLQTFMGISLPF